MSKAHAQTAYWRLSTVVFATPLCLESKRISMPRSTISLFSCSPGATEEELNCNAHARAVRILFYLCHLQCDICNWRNCSRLKHQALSQKEEGTVVHHPGSCHLMHLKLDSGNLVSLQYLPSCGLRSPICISSGGWILFYLLASLPPHHTASVSKIITESFTFTFPEYQRCLLCATHWWNKLLLLKMEISILTCCW